ncbi:PEP-CTERM sorting domain-containing protein [Sedimenticola sp.]|uniref:PEP-CTERM sorting domain-containing protein n=1 Tax=Sedimenticola sp. TaxID=1940285 RepID=UPI003D0DD85A
MFRQFSAICLLVFVGSASAVTLPAPIYGPTGPFYGQYDDFYSYSLPLLNYFSDPSGQVVLNLSTATLDDTLNAGDPWYVNSSPGELGKDGQYIVLATGTNNQGVNDNSDVSSLIDPAYETPDGGGANSDSFSTVTSDSTANPYGGTLAGAEEPDYGDTPNGNTDGFPDFTQDSTDSWDINVGSLVDFLNGEEMVVFFNHNELGDTQELSAWVKVWFTDLDGNIIEVDKNGGFYTGDDTEDAFYLRDTFYNGVNNLGDGNFGIDNPELDDWALAPGDVCIDTNNIAAGIDIGCQVYNPNDPGIEKFNHNLGANNAAYAIYSPWLNQFIAGLLNPEDYVMHVDMRLSGEDNGYEQAFISTFSRVTNVPEPSTLFVLAIGLLGLGATLRWRHRH